VLEAGPPTHDDPAHVHPAFFISHLAPDSRTVRAHAGRPSAALDGRAAIVQAGQCLGGGGSVNCASSLSRFSFLFLGKKSSNADG
jgi:alcohol oxidase